MARNLNLDTQRSLQEAISFTVNGVTFECVDLTDEVMEEISNLADDETLGIGELLARQIATFTGKTVEAFEGLNIQQKSAIIDHITSSMTDPLGRKQRRNAARR